MTTYYVATPFDANSKKYRCFCGFMHVITATIILGIIELVLLCGAIAQAVFNFLRWKDEEYFKWFLVTVIGSGLAFLFVILMFIGIGITRPKMVIPHLFAQFIALIVFIGLFVISLINLWIGQPEWYLGPEVAAGPEKDREAYQKSFSLITIPVCVLGFCLTVWWIFIVYKTFRYLKGKRDALENPAAAPAPSSVAMHYGNAAAPPVAYAYGYRGTYVTK